MAKEAGLPFVDGDAIVSSNGSRCDLCEKVHGDRVHYPTIKLKGHVYDDTTFVSAHPVRTE